MAYKKIFLLFHLVTWGGLLLVYLNFVFWSSSDLAFYLFMVGILYFILLAYVPAILKKQKRILVASFGSREDQDLQAHVAEAFFRKVLNGGIIAQLDPKDEAQLVAFAEGLKGMYGEEVASLIQGFYPELSVDRIDAFLDVCVRVGKEVMFYVFFPEKHGGADQAVAQARLAEQYAFLSPALIRRLYLWWQRIKAGQEREISVHGG